MAARNWCGVRLGILVLGSFLPAVLVKFGVDAVILKGPENITAPIGAIATFHCLAQGDDAFWEINDTIIEYPEDQDPFTENGFMFSETINYETSTYNFTMTVNAMPENNNTRITCLVYQEDYHSRSGRLTVMVPQPPPSPKPQLLVLNATTIQLSWLPPFSWTEYPIVNYSVQVYNRATGEMMNSFINATSEVLSTTAPVTSNYGVPQGRVMQNCEELVFIVSAANTIGWGSPAVVTGGFPIAPRLETNASSIKSTVTFQFDGTPLLLLNIQLPGICPFQEMSYTITIQQISPTHNTISTAGQADNILVIGPKTAIGHRNVYEVVNSSLVVDAVYSVLVEFDTLAGNVSSTTTFVTATSFNTATPSLCPCSSKGEYPQPTTDYPNITATAGTTTDYPNITATAGAGRHSQPTTITESTNITATRAAGPSLVEQIAMGVSISLVIIIGSAIVLLMICGFIYWRRTSGEKSVEKPCDAMATNPIFEGPQCGSIQPEFKNLTTPHPTAEYNAV